MPLYEYRCRKCGTQIERIQKFSDPLLTICEECGGELEQMLSAPAIQFKGSGWYVNDYGKSGSTKPAGEQAEKAAEKASDNKSDAAKSETSAAKGDGSSSTSSSKEAKAPEPAPAKS